jgi:hypothetical protein
MLTKTSQTKTIGCIFVAGLSLRIGALLTVAPPPLDTSAQIAYWGDAHILTHGKGFADPAYPVFAPPLYAVFIATCLTLFGETQVPVKTAQAILDSPWSRQHDTTTPRAEGSTCP